MPGTRQGQTGKSRDNQRQAGTRQGPTGTSQGKTGKNKNKQGQSLSVPVCPCPSLLVPVCPYFPVCPCLSVLVPVCPCLSLSFPVVPCLPMPVLVCLSGNGIRLLRNKLVKYTQKCLPTFFSKKYNAYIFYFYAYRRIINNIFTFVTLNKSEMTLLWQWSSKDDQAKVWRKKKLSLQGSLFLQYNPLVLLHPRIRSLEYCQGFLKSSPCMIHCFTQAAAPLGKDIRDHKCVPHVPADSASGLLTG